MNIQEAEKYFRGRVEEIRGMLDGGSAFVFLLSTAYIEYLARTALNRETHGCEIVKFIEDWFDSRYKSFMYVGGQRDLPLQMYCNLRCGLVHSFSLIPDDGSLRKGARERSIILTHKANKSGTHLQNWTSEDAHDAALFVAEDYIDDISKTTDAYFNRAYRDTMLKSNIEAWTSRYPPLGLIN